jgi:hypothetical protein
LSITSQRFKVKPDETVREYSKSGWDVPKKEAIIGGAIGRDGFG